jgi:hypothetical protein
MDKLESVTETLLCNLLHDVHLLAIFDICDLL